MVIDMERIYYKKGYKYQSSRQRQIMTEFRPESEIKTIYGRLETNGLLTAFPRYAWDGASGCPDFEWIMRGSFWHDLGYQMIREGVMPPESKTEWDALLKKCCLEDGAWKWQASLVEKAVKKFGKAAAHPNNRRRELCAP
jgi:hypothetical protein